MVKEIAGDKVKGMDAVAEAEGKEIQVAAEEEAKEVLALFLGMIPMVMDNLLELNEERVVAGADIHLLLGMAQTPTPLLRRRRRKKRLLMLFQENWRWGSKPLRGRRRR